MEEEVNQLLEGEPEIKMSVIPLALVAVSRIIKTIHSIEGHHYVYKRTWKAIRRDNYRISRYLKKWSGVLGEQFLAEGLKLRVCTSELKCKLIFSSGRPEEDPWIEASVSTGTGRTCISIFYVPSYLIYRLI